MGRGRQKAKHTKIARELKYDSYTPNFAALERELGHSGKADDEYVDEWADQSDEHEDDEEQPARTGSSRV